MIVVLGTMCSYVANKYAGGTIIAYLPDGSECEHFDPTIVVVRTIKDLSDAVVKHTRMDDSLSVCADEGTKTDIKHLRAAAAMVRHVFMIRQQHLGTIEKFGNEWNVNAIKNLPALSKLPTVGDLRLDNVPVIVVGPGPSLRRNIDALGSAAGKAFIVALNRAARPLCEAGIYPDMVAVVDSGKIILEHLEGLPMDRIGSLALEQSCEPRLFDLPIKKLWYEGRGGLLKHISDIIGNATSMPGGATVAASAVGIALACGSSKIALCGIDMALEDGKRYESFEAHDNKREVAKLKSWNGKCRVISPMDLYATHTWMVSTASKRKDVSFFNCSEGGAFANGFNHIRLSKFISGLKREIDARALIDSLAERDSSSEAKLRAADITLDNPTYQYELERMLHHWK